MPRVSILYFSIMLLSALIAAFITVFMTAAASGQTVDRNDMFRSDGADASEALRYLSLTSVYVPFSLSSGMNRTLLYGSPAWPSHPVSEFAPYPTFFYTPRSFAGNGMISPAQAYELAAGSRNGIDYRPYPGAIATPELYLFWENGAFGQNTFNARVSRPLSQNMMFSAFANYRYLNGTQFDHERNDIANFYKFFYSDTSKVMNRGYNPLVEEFAAGGSLLRTGADSSKFFASFTYNDFKNEYALDLLAASSEELNWASLDRSVYRVNAALTGVKAPLSSIAGLRLSFINEDVNSRYEPDTTVETYRMVTNNLIFDADVVTPVSIGLRAGGLIRGIDVSNGNEWLFADYYTGLFYDRNLLPRNHALGVLDLKIYADALWWQCDGKTCLDPDIGASVDFKPRNVPLARLNVYARTDPQRTAGAEGEMEFRYFGMLLGYRRTDKGYAGYAWPQNAAPYAQPGNTFIIAPRTKRLGGFSLLSRAMVTDTRPYLKTTLLLSQIIRPKEMAHTFEFELGFDYWSERDPVMFAGLNEWSDPIFDVNLKVAAHIRSFRLFYKIDNILNRRQAYIPGYFSPGLTFRWGINWMI